MGWLKAATVPNTQERNVEGSPPEWVELEVRVEEKEKQKVIHTGTICKMKYSLLTMHLSQPLQ
jgi:hypothetical protein